MDRMLKEFRPSAITWRVIDEFGGVPVWCNRRHPELIVGEIEDSMTKKRYRLPSAEPPLDRARAGLH